MTTAIARTDTDDALPLRTAGLPVAQEVPVNDDAFLAYWLECQRSPHTKAAYRVSAERFRRFAGKPLYAVTRRDLLRFERALAEEGMAPRSVRVTMARVKALLSFAEEQGYTSFNVGRAHRLPRPQNRLAERILTEAQVLQILALETNPRNQAILKVLYYSAVRVSELCGLRWRDCLEREGGAGQVTVQGKGGKTRAILLPPVAWEALVACRQSPEEDAPVFPSPRKPSVPLTRRAILNIVRAASLRAGIDKPVSPHFFRHSHATHALDRQAPIHLVSATLGHSSLATTGQYAHVRPGESSGRYLIR